MKTKTPLISILIPSYNHQSYIAQCINSILFQTYNNFEIIVVDDNSTDESEKIIKNIKDKKIEFYKNSFNRGMNATLSEAFKHTHGDYIAITGSDDFFDRYYLEEFVKFINAQKEEYTVFYPQIVPVDDNGDILSQKNKTENKKFPTNNEVLRELFLHGNTLASPGMIMSRKAAKKIFPLDAGIHQHQDFIMHIQLLFMGECAFIPEAITYYRVPTDTNGHMSSNSRKAYKRIEIETPFALNYFLKHIKTKEQLENIFGEMLLQYGKPQNDTIPYFLSRIALDSKDNRLLNVWGARTLIEYLNKSENQLLLHEKYDFDYRQFSALMQNVKLLDDFLEEQEKTFKNSFSWKITAPIRKIADLLKKGKSK